MQGGLAVSHTFPLVSRHHLARMPRELPQLHNSWCRDAETDIDDNERRFDRASALAHVLIDAGEEPSLVETRLMRLEIPPGIAAS